MGLKYGATPYERRLASSNQTWFARKYTLFSPIFFPAIKLHSVRAGISQPRLITGR